MIKALILATALALTPIATHAAPPADNAPITTEELNARAKICVGIAAGEVDTNKVIQVLELNTLRKRRDFVLQCKMLILGVEVGRALPRASGR